MALRVCSKINNGVPRICMKLLSNNVPQLASFRVPEDNSPTATKEKESSDSISFVKPSISSNQRTSPIDTSRRWSNAFETEQEMEHRTIENKFLQPATMPGYSERPFFDHKFLASLQEPEIKKAQDVTLNNSASQNILEVLKKKKNQNSYIKFTKMTSSPFPDPIKAIFSQHTISDEEKARQMFDDHKMARMAMSNHIENGTLSSNNIEKDNGMKSKKFHGSVHFSSNITKNSENFCGLDQAQKRCYSTEISKNLTDNHLEEFSFDTLSNSANGRRFYSKKKKCEKSEVCVDKQKCPKEKSCIPAKCDKIKIKGCPAIRDDGICRERIQEVKCTKIEAPYPSFSEKCYLEPRPKHSECEICPWSRKDNPNFKSKIKLPRKELHTMCGSGSVSSPPSERNLAQKFQRSSAEVDSHQSSVWMHTASLSQIQKAVKKLPKIDAQDFGKVGEAVYNLFKDDGCEKVDKDSEKCKKISPGPCKGAKLRKPIDYLKEHFEKSKGKKDDAKCDTTIYDRPLGYCVQQPTHMTEFLMKNTDLLTNFRNGDDLGDFGVDKGELSKLLCRPGVTGISLEEKKGERLIPEYPENCEKPYMDNTKKCPTGLTYKKTNKDRLKRKKPKISDVCDKK